MELALGLFEENKLSNKAILLLSDGENHGGDLYGIAEKSRDMGVRIYALGIGTEAGSPMPKPRGGYVKERGKLALTYRDTTGLMLLAEQTKGAYANSIELAYAPLVCSARSMSPVVSR